MSTTKTRRSGEKPPRDPNAPKRPLSGYFLFGKDQRAKDEGLAKMSVSEQGQVISERWKKLSDAERKVYKDKSKEERTTYDKEIEEYKKTSQYQEYMSKMAKFAEKAGKKKKDRKATAYGEFFKCCYKRVAEENPALSMGENTSLIAKQWKNLPADEKSKYQGMADDKNATKG
jgi:hypothetical protein